MKPRYVVYGLEDEFNVERFKRLVKKEGYRILEDSLPSLIFLRRCYFVWIRIALFKEQ